MRHFLPYEAKKAKEKRSVSYTDRLLEYLNTLPDALLYFVLGLSAFVENVFPPIPGDTITGFGAFLVGIRRLHFWGVYISTTLGSLTGFMLLFWLGRALGRRFFMDKDYRFFKAQDVARAEVWFEKYGSLLVLLNRFFPGIRSVISIAAGMTSLRGWRVAGLALVSCAAWNLIWIGVGYTLGSNWDMVKERMGLLMARYNMAILVVLVLIVAWLLLRKRTGRKR
jgi:membrane protein DedA with SNARE-associated domain